MITTTAEGVTIIHHPTNTKVMSSNSTRPLLNAFQRSHSWAMCLRCDQRSEAKQRTQLLTTTIDKISYRVYQKCGQWPQNCYTLGLMWIMAISEVVFLTIKNMIWNNKLMNVEDYNICPINDSQLQLVVENHSSDKKLSHWTSYKNWS